MAAPPLATLAEDIRTVQLHPTGRETALPVIGLDSGQTLTLSFDRLDGGRGGPLSVTIIHYDRFWRPRLVAAEYLAGFQGDEIREVRPSAGTRVRFTHYTYTFPNQLLSMRRSGNFAIRVTEFGDDRAVLLERPFFVTEEAASLELDVRSGLGSGLGGPFRQPVADLQPVPRFDSPLFEYDVCFARDGLSEPLRCSEEPRLTGTSFQRFFLSEQRTFLPPAARFPLDLTVLGAGPGIASVDLGANPFRVELVPDLLGRATALLRDEMLLGQPQIATQQRAVFEPATGAEYVETRFALETNGERLAGPVYLVGAFNGWQRSDAWRLSWNAAERRYDGAFLIKQGRYTYAYHFEDRAVAEAERRTNTLAPTVYTAFAYLHEPALRTDRLVAVRSIAGS